MFEFLYLIQDKNDMGTNIYKIGKTTQGISDRLKGYPRGTRPIRISQVDNCDKRETELINIFKTKYVLSRGREYFEGDLNSMIKDFTNFCDSIKVLPNNVNNNTTNNNSNNNSNSNNITNNNYVTNINITPKTFKCNKCHEIFKTKNNLIKHINKKIKCNITTEFQCIICLKYFSCKKSLNEHCKKNNCVEKQNINENIEYLNDDNNNKSKIRQVLKLYLESNMSNDDKAKLIKIHINTLEIDLIKTILKSDLPLDGKVLAFSTYIP